MFFQINLGMKVREVTAIWYSPGGMEPGINCWWAQNLPAITRYLRATISLLKMVPGNCWHAGTNQKLKANNFPGSMPLLKILVRMVTISLRHIMAINGYALPPGHGSN